MLVVKNAWYRTSVKWIVYSDSWKVMLCKEESGVRDLPWWGLDRWEDPISCLERELFEEMWLKADSIDPRPITFIATEKPASNKRPWISNICYEVVLLDLNFSPSDECTEIWFFNLSDIENIQTLPNVMAVFKNIFSEE